MNYHKSRRLLYTNAYDFNCQNWNEFHVGYVSPQTIPPYVNKCNSCTAQTFKPLKGK